MTIRRQRDKEQTIQDVLSAAKRLFAENGFHGTSIRDIENASGVSKGLILHHFLNKEALYDAVQESIIREYTSVLSRKGQDNIDLKEVIAATVRGAFLHAKGDREYQRIALWSYLEGRENPSLLEKRFTAQLIAAMQDGQKVGLVRDDIDPLVMPFIIKGAIEYWVQKRKLIAEISNHKQELDQDADDLLVNALIKIFLR